MTASITALPVRKAVVVHASIEDAFEVFTGEVDTWWPRCAAASPIGTSR